jgi:hypothetical protein
MVPRGIAEPPKPLGNRSRQAAEQQQEIDEISGVSPVKE